MYDASDLAVPVILQPQRPLTAAQQQRRAQLPPAELLALPGPEAAPSPSTAIVAAAGASRPDTPMDSDSPDQRAGDGGGGGGDAGAGTRGRQGSADRLTSMLLGTHGGQDHTWDAPGAVNAANCLHSIREARADVSWGGGAAGRRVRHAHAWRPTCHVPAVLAESLLRACAGMRRKMSGCCARVTTHGRSDVSHVAGAAVQAWRHRLC